MFKCLRRTLVVARTHLATHKSSHHCRTPHISALKHEHRVAVRDGHGDHTYGSLLSSSHQLAQQIKQTGDVDGERIVYLTPNDSTNVVCQWAIWLSGAIAVPLCATHPLSEKQYFVDDSQAKLVIGTQSFGDEVIKLSKNASTSCLIINSDPKDVSSGEINHPDRYLEQVDRGGVPANQRSLIIYTSGTTGRPKGVVHTHGSMMATTQDMIEAWEWTKEDRMLHVLPLHHIHGLINALYIPLSIGASSLMLPKFSPKQAWHELISESSGVTVITAVPTIYAKLLEYYESGVDPDLTAEVIQKGVSKIRAMMCASSLLATVHSDLWLALTGHRLMDRYGMSEILTAIASPLHGHRKQDKWCDLTSHTLLERYGMSEILMALTHLISDDKRKKGTVGVPFRSVEAMVAQVDSSIPEGYTDVTNQISETRPDQSVEGELYIRGPSLFTEYWNKPEASVDSFTTDGWFKTGDTVCRDSDGYFRILGRTSVDIIKSGGYKISALDIESKILLHDDILECSVLGVPSTVYGQEVAALLVLKPEATITEAQFMSWCSERIPKYSTPKSILILQSIPKNAMNKVNKKQLLAKYFPQDS